MACLHYLAAAMKIHVSNSCAQLLLQAGGFELEKRGTIQVKVCRSSYIHINACTVHSVLCMLGEGPNDYMVA